MENIRDIVDCIEMVPTLPSVVRQVIKSINDPRSSAQSVAKVLISDTAISSRVLKVVNSVYYGFSRQISRITQAAALLGNFEIRNLVLTTSVFSLFKGMEQSLYNNLIQHSVHCALTGKTISSFIRWKMPEEVFISGLLHDIGKFVIAEYFPREFQEIDKIMTEENCSTTDAEAKVLGVSHTTIGQWLCEKWNR